MRDVSDVFDVIIVGCGPAGSTAANLLSQAGRRVLVLEREQFPRFHIGESLLPIDLPLFERLGVKIDAAAYRFKQGAEFWDERSGAYAYFSFADAMPGTPSHAWQVDRATFDLMLADQARARGAEVRFGVTVRDMRADPDGVTVVTDEGGGAEHRARYLFDATGQDAWLARRARSVSPIRELGRAAVFTHFEGLSPEVRAELEPRGDIKVMLVEDGWHWLIPLIGGRLSVGLVKWRGKLDEAALDAALAASPLIQRLTAGARRGPTRTIANWSYKNTQSAGPRWACVGDAAAFLDPVFSSGVSLAMLGAEKAVDLLLPALAAGQEADARLMAPWATHMQPAYDAFEQLIRRFYHTRLVDHLFFAAEPDPALRRGLISVLAGDVWRRDNPFQTMLESSRLQAKRVATADESAQ
ncbi:MAG: tryptophan 7-halogenase [Nannocystis sp.]|nr:NAD(P)/FAD-dependent oxidoreductase [Nannocystis sp.]MBA3549950.1 tryptophan 7-halogenase [Nannocystis sp.]